MKKIYLIPAALVICVAIIQACTKLQPAAPADDEILDGPVAGLSYDQNRHFLAGDVAFNNEVFTSQLKGRLHIHTFFALPGVLVNFDPLRYNTRCGSGISSFREKQNL